MKPTQDQIASFTNMVRQFREFAEFIESWRQQELEQLPYAKDNLDVLRGRVQTLTEMQRHIGLRK